MRASGRIITRQVKHRLKFGLLLCLTLLTLPGCYACSSGPSENTILSIAQGEVLVRKAGTDDWVKGEVSMVLKAGDAIKSGTEANASITFFDGSTVGLNANTQIEIAELVNEQAKVIRLKQKIGETISTVQKMVDPASRYEIETPAAVAGVRGSVMLVDVALNGITSVGNEEGMVSVIAQGVEIQVPEGTHSTVLPGQAPGAPEPGVRPAAISTPVFGDTVGDLFDESGVGTTGEDYLDIVKSQVSAVDALYIVHLELKGPCPVKASDLTMVVEWDILIDVDADSSTGFRWPLIGNDLGYDYLARVILIRAEYRGEILNISADSSSEIESIVAVYNYDTMGNIVELYFPATAIDEPTQFSWIIAVRKYMIDDQPNQPSVSDKSPDTGHYLFP